MKATMISDHITSPGCRWGGFSKKGRIEERGASVGRKLAEELILRISIP